MPVHGYTLNSTTGDFSLMVRMVLPLAFQRGSGAIKNLLSNTVFL
ncbi:hypothetical protein YPPY94_2207 [Yersinia pestis PY-94]|uniref:Uncharacterized protein n=1 Tax=Yersinia pestis biovar Orientalis str. IP275 TaxID=373665 RepID=A0AAV3AUI5_YERPE|nr:hypothetical protein YPIP275_1542 [Yersinia pestis biovar Orientalis str. IP275]EDR52743.1 hypothetical protein YpB42003004_1252 [Yersinia pestis biovar Antiqua str. B42003004]EIR49876.1 hypothetical protein YPPY14_2169 [Yersinia pestis PY-14]EIR89253.1 hypothetical protein YPPY36_2338 [Yersinia pestis PY-36]EIT17324.1 hypothetical protein YPPY94_2207 [Yersinia pestis PY-94]